jgi:DNA topoisomerase-1
MTNQNILVVVESQSKTKIIEQYLGPEYRCVSTFGHLRELKNISDINFDEIEKTHYSIINTSLNLNRIVILRDAVKNSNEVIIATDDDREGESIGWHFCKLFNLNINTTKRIIFHEITETAIKSAIHSPTTLNINIIRAQQTRQIIDLLFGFKITPMLWNSISSNNKLSAGRCQSPTLKIIYENNNDVLANLSKKVFHTVGYFTKLNIPFKLNKLYDSASQINAFLYNTIDFKHTITIQPPVFEIHPPPSPFSTSLLQQNACSELNLTPENVMTICQKLYENGHITYIRTTGTKYSSTFVDIIKKYIIQNHGETYVNEKINDIILTSTDNVAHEAIRPTNISVNKLSDDYTPKEKKIYKLIWSNTLESCMANEISLALESSISAPNDLQYKNTSIISHFLGWKIINHKNDAMNENYHFLLSYANNSKLQYNKITSTISLSEKVSYLSESKLIKLLEERGIGRPSTYSALIEKIKDNGYVCKKHIEGEKITCQDYILENKDIIVNNTIKIIGKEKNKLVIQPLGVSVIEFLLKNCHEMIDYDYSKHMEELLDNISNGEENYNKMCVNYNNSITQIIDKKINTKTKQSEKEENNLGTNSNGDKIVIKKGKYGLYANVGNISHSLKHLGNRPVENITMQDITNILEEKNTTTNIIRVLNESISIRKGAKGKGDYIYFKTLKMTKPRFITLSNFEENYVDCDIFLLYQWLKKYNIYI